VATTDGKVVFLWDARARRNTAAFQGVTGVATSMSFSRDSRTLIVADARPDGSGALDLLSIRRLALMRQVIVPPFIQLALSRDGKILFSADRAGRVWLLDTRTWRPIGAPLLANANRFAIDPADRLLATSSTAGAVQLWDVRSGRPLGGPLPGTAGGAARLAFTAGGSALVTLRPDGSGFVWDVRPNSWAQRACAIAGRPLSAQEWRDALHEISYTPACATHQ
jgi:WD40 repeat protein